MMSWTMVFLLLGVWVLGLVSGYTFGGILHILLLYAALVATARLLHRRRPIHGQSSPTKSASTPPGQ